MPRVAITALGFATCLGHTRAQVLAALRSSQCGLRRWSEADAAGFPVHVAGWPQGFDTTSPDPVAWSWPGEYPLDPGEVRMLSPHGLYALWAVEDALAGAGLDRAALADANTGLACASTGSMRQIRHHLNRMEKQGWRRGHPLGLISSAPGSLNMILGSLLGIRGASCGFLSACASSSHALASATESIRRGQMDRMLVVAGEDLSFDILAGFLPLGALSKQKDPTRASRPFHRERDGFVGSGGAVAMLLEAEHPARERQATVHAWIAGWGEASDAFHPVRPHPEGRGLESAMRAALADARLTPDAVDHVCAHATSTPAGDLAEASALQRVFTGRAKPPWVTAPKSLVGHSLSFSGIHEIALSVLGMQHGFLPGQPNLDDPDPECASLRIPKQTTRAKIGVVLNNCSAFGGANVCQVLTHPDHS